MKFLLDENIINKSATDDVFTNSTDVIGRGATDRQVFQYALKHNLIVVTHDKAFVLEMIIAGSKAVFVNHKNRKGVLIKPGKVEKSKHYSCPVTHYIQKNDCVVIP